MMKVGIYDYDCILLYLMIPGGNGLDILRRIKQHKPETEVIIVSAKGAPDHKIEGLRIGADGDIAKPFHLSELSVRIFALLRRKNSTDSNILESGNVKIDLLDRKSTIDRQKLDFTKSEYKLLLFLIKNHNRVVSKSAIAEHLSGDMAVKTYYGPGYKWQY